MGISGLLPLLKSIQKPCNLKKFAGQTIGVDTYGWLHRGTATCAIELAQGKPTTKFVDFAMHRVRMLIHFGITPYLVFDGDYLPSKGGTEKERADKRKESRRLGLELLKMGKTSQAHAELQKAVDVTPEMARMLIEELKHHNIQYVVAPYEADAQLVYLERNRIIDGILSEDSDLLVFGAKCLLTKLDKYGECVEINRNLFTACREVSLAGWTDADFRRMAILSGCDYLPGIGKMGLKTAHRMLRKYKTVERVVKTAQFDGQFKVTPNYLESFYEAENTFLYQWVFCPQANKIVNLTPLEPTVDATEMPYIGKVVPADIAISVAHGDIHPHTKNPIIVDAKDHRFIKPLRPARGSSSIVQTPNSKQSKPIDAFFKPKRTPLAELDPNSFTPSPSQNAVMQRHSSSSWATALAPEPLSQQSYVPRSAPVPPRRALSEGMNRRSSMPHPPKRQRLCSDSVSDAAASTEKSPFFSSSTADPSPSVRPAKKSRKNQIDEFNLFSDEVSAEEAMIEIADLEEAASQRSKKMTIFKDDFRSSVNSDSQSTTFSRSITENSQGTVGTLTPATSFGTPTQEIDEESVSSVALSKQVKDLRSRFLYSSSCTRSPSTSTGDCAEVEPRGSILRSTSPSHVAKNIAVPNTPHKSSRTKAIEETSVPDDTGDDLGDAAWVALESGVVVPGSDTASKPSSPTKADIQGSEDLLIPDSEAESDASPRKPIFSLGHFAFGR